MSFIPETRDSFVERLVTNSTVEMKCCADNQWRGRFCNYHQGYEDGLDAALDALGYDEVINGIVKHESKGVQSG